jgi:quinoprotein glucose dehydrogenase
MRFFSIFLTTVLLVGAADSIGDWPVYGHDPGGQRFSPLTAINRNNVKTMKIADLSDRRRVPSEI